MASPPALPRGQATAAGHRPQPYPRPYPLHPPASSQAAEGPAAPRWFAAARRHSLAPPGSPGALRPAGGPGWAGPGRAALPAAPAGCLKGGGSHRERCGVRGGGAGAASPAAATGALSGGWAISCLSCRLQCVWAALPTPARPFSPMGWRSSSAETNPEVRSPRLGRRRVQSAPMGMEGELGKPARRSSRRDEDLLWATVSCGDLGDHERGAGLAGPARSRGP